MKRVWSMNEYLRFGRLGSQALVAAILLATAGCATSVTPTPIRYADLGSGRLASLDLRAPFVIEFQAGDSLPVNFELTSEDFELSPAHPTMMLVAKQHCFVRFSADGIRSSLDPKNFDKPKTPGTFRIGLNAQRGQPAKLDVIIATPRR